MMLPGHAIEAGVQGAGRFLEGTAKVLSHEELSRNSGYGQKQLACRVREAGTRLSMPGLVV